MVQCRHGLGNVAEKQSKGPIECGAAGDHDIVARPKLSLLRSLLKICRESSLEAPPDTVPGNGVADLFRNCESEARALAGALNDVGPLTHFNQKCRRR